MNKKKRTWKFWLSRTILTLLLIGGIWLTNLIWFRPFSIRNFYDKVFLSLALRSPETVTALGIPVVDRWTKDELDDVSDASLWENFRQTKKDYKTLLSYDFESQSPANKLSTRILTVYLKNEMDREPFFYHDYPINQLQGIQNSLPSLLASKHKLKSKSDVEAYIKRLVGFEIKFNQVIEGLKIREQKGIVPPKFVIKRVLDEMKGFVGNGVEKNILYTNFLLKVAAIEVLSSKEKAAYSKQVADKIQSSVFKAYQQLIDYHEKLYAKATTDDGVWKLPNGDSYYRHQLKVLTTTDITPEEVYQMGLKEVERIENEMREILKKEGYTDTSKSLGAIMQNLGKQERFLFPEVIVILFTAQQMEEGPGTK